MGARRAPLALRLLLPMVAAVGAACAESGDFEILSHRYQLADAIQYKLPKVLREISGLALDETDRLFAHQDEAGVIFEVDYAQGRVVRRFALSGAVKDDFEGIAIVGQRLFLVTSSGTLYETRIGASESLVPYRRHGHQLDCEVEGLAYLARRNALLLACKNLLERDKSTALKLYQWNLASGAFDPEATIVVSREALVGLQQAQGQDPATKKLQATGITVAPNGNLLVVAARQHLLLELTLDGTPVTLAQLDDSRHRQAEGVAVTADFRLLLADEGDSKGSNKSRGRLSVYHPTD